jgi:hypothetical protein
LQRVGWNSSVSANALARLLHPGARPNEFPGARSVLGGGDLRPIGMAALKPSLRRAEVVTVVDFRRSGVQRPPGANRGVFRPPLPAQRTLRDECGVDYARRGGEGDAASMGLTLPTVTPALESLIEVGMVGETTGRQCNRVFAYGRYIDAEGVRGI